MRVDSVALCEMMIPKSSINNFYLQNLYSLPIFYQILLYISPLILNRSSRYHESMTTLDLCLADRR